VKIKGAELAAWTDEAWPGDDWYWDHELFNHPKPDETYDTDEIGGIYYQGNGTDPTHGDGYDLAKLIVAWRKSRSHKVMTIEVPKDRVSEVVSALKAMGVRAPDPA